jgi:putative transcriptional regulator
MKNMNKPKNNFDLTHLRPGNVLIAQEFWTSELFNRSVILILKHDEEGSAGIILNKSDVIAENLRSYSRNIKMGEAFDLNTGILCKLQNISKNEETLSDIYTNDPDEDISRLRKIIDGHKAGNSRNFVVLTAWEPGQLEQQIVEHKWWIHDFNVQELYEVETSELWKHKLLKSKNLYGLFSDVPDPVLN